MAISEATLVVSPTRPKPKRMSCTLSRRRRPHDSPGGLLPRSAGGRQARRGEEVWHIKLELHQGLGRAQVAPYAAFGGFDLQRLRGWPYLGAISLKIKRAISHLLVHDSEGRRRPGPPQAILGERIAARVAGPKLSRIHSDSSHCLQPNSPPSLPKSASVSVRAHSLCSASVDRL